MYYKRLEEISKSSEFNEFFSTSMLESINNFILNEISAGYDYFNPYKFALSNKISIESSLKLFLSLTDDNKLLKPEAFIDCPRCIGKRLSLEPTIVDENDNYVLCEDCADEYDPYNYEKSLYILFKFNDDVHIPDETNQINEHDPNSTHDVIKRIDENLKGKSPSQLSGNEYNWEGDLQKGVSLNEVKENNKSTDGSPISNSTANLEKNLMNLLFSDVS